MIKGIGIDVVEINRVKQALERGKEHFLSRVYTKQEIDYCKTGKDSIQRYAVRFAAKEAAMKALGTGWARGICWQDIEIIPGKEGAPQLTLKGKSLEMFEQIGAKKIHVSLSHHKMFASALVIIES